MTARRGERRGERQGDAGTDASGRSLARTARGRQPLLDGVEQRLDGSARAGDDGLRLQDSGSTLLKPLATVTTAPLTPLNPPEPYLDDFGTPFEVYAAAPFRFTPAPGTIAPGDDVAFQVGTKQAIAPGTAVTCAPPPPIKATIDVIPGLASNPVIPSLRLPVLPVRVFGSAALDVTKIASVKLGNASPVVIPSWLAPVFKPKDRKGTATSTVTTSSFRRPPGSPAGRLR